MDKEQYKDWVDGAVDILHDNTILSKPRIKLLFKKTPLKIEIPAKYVKTKSLLKNDYGGITLLTPFSPNRHTPNFSNNETYCIIIKEV